MTETNVATRPGITRRNAWRLAAAGATAATGATVAMPAASAEAATGIDRQVSSLLNRRSRTRRKLNDIIDARLVQFEKNFAETRLPTLVGQPGAFQTALDLRYLAEGAPVPVEAPSTTPSVVLTQAAYEALAVRDPETLYVVVG